MGIATPPIAFMGQSVNGSGTRVASIKAIGTNAVDVTNTDLFAGMCVRHGTDFIPVDEAIEMGILAFQGGTLVELNGPGAVAWPG